MEELLGTELDKFGNEIKIYFCSHENMPAKVTAFFAKQWAELLEAGHATHNSIPNIHACRMIYITSNDEIIGLRLWVWEQTNTRIILTAIDKNYRRRGLLKVIIKYYDNRMISNDCKQSVTYIHVNNNAMIEAATQSGYRVEFLKMIKRYEHEQ